MKKALSALLALVVAFTLLASVSSAEEAALTPHQQRLVLLAALFHQDDPLGLSCNDDPSGLKNFLTQFMQVNDHDSCLAKIDELIDVGLMDLRATYSSLLKGEDWIDQNCTPEDAARYRSCLKNVARASETILGELPITAEELAAVTSIEAFDLINAASAARMGVRCGYISEQEAWDVLERVATRVEALFPTWKSYCASYLLGTSINSKAGDISVLIPISKWLLTEGYWNTEAIADEMDYLALGPVRTFTVEKQAFTREPVDPATLSAERQRLLLAFASIQHPGDPDSLSCTEQDEAALRRELEESWRTTDHDTAFESLCWLLYEGSRADNDYNFQIIITGTDFMEANADNIPYLIYMVNLGEDLIAAAESLQEDLSITDETLGQLWTIAGWDCTLAADLARKCYSVGYISEGEAWAVLEEVAVIAQQNFPTWQDYYTSFIMGRTMVQTVEGVEDYNATAKQLFTDGTWSESAIQEPTE